MLAPGPKPVARRAATCSTTETDRPTARPRRALGSVDEGAGRRLGRITVGALASAALVGGLTWAGTAPAAAQSAGHNQPRLFPGKTGSKVVRLQRELTAHGLKVPDTGYYGPITESKVKRMQRNQGWKQTGVAGFRVWHRLFTDGHQVKPVKKRPQPSKPGGNGGNGSGKPQHSTKVGRDFGKPRLHFGQTNANVVQLQRELTAHGLKVPSTGYFGPMTRGKVNTLQKRHGFKVTGVAGHKVWGVLLHDGKKPKKLPKLPAAVDSRCKTGGRVLCVDKTTRTLYYLENNRVQKKLDARFGCSNTATRNGVFSVFRKNRHWTSTLYWTPMPYSMFFSGGQAVHYSSDFNARGYAGCSHGCVNIREKKKLAWVFNRVRVGDRLVVYYS